MQISQIALHRSGKNIDFLIGLKIATIKPINNKKINAFDILQQTQQVIKKLKKTCEEYKKSSLL